eukprot:s183_g22.t1
MFVEGHEFPKQISRLDTRDARSTHPAGYTSIQVLLRWPPFGGHGQVHQWHSGERSADKRRNQILQAFGWWTKQGACQKKSDVKAAIVHPRRRKTSQTAEFLKFYKFYQTYFCLILRDACSTECTCLLPGRSKAAPLELFCYQWGPCPRAVAHGSRQITCTAAWWFHLPHEPGIIVPGWVGMENKRRNHQAKKFSAKLHSMVPGTSAGKI